jgi:hypothetical protein
LLRSFPVIIALHDKFISARPYKSVNCQSPQVKIPAILISPISFENLFQQKKPASKFNSGGVDLNRDDTLQARPSGYEPAW